MLQNLSWLDHYSFGQLEDIRKEIVKLQVDKANDLANKIRDDVATNATLIQNIDNQIAKIDQMGLSDTYKNEIGQWRSWKYNINELKQYKVNSAEQLDPFRYYAKACGLDGSLSVQNKLNEWAGKFSEIINAIQTNNPDQYNRHQRIQKLKRRLSGFRGQYQQLINNIQNMLYENDFYVYKEIGKQTNYMTQFKKYCNALTLLSGHMEILKRNSWRNLTHDQIIQEIGNRINNMYNLCYNLRLQRQQNFYFGSNQDINNGLSKTNGVYGLLPMYDR